MSILAFFSLTHQFFVSIGKGKQNAAIKKRKENLLQNLAVMEGSVCVH